ncbi:MAG: cation:proton antiporter [Pyrinomonadaceae bacterium]|nr:cation:proton antiporter [Pyrinomonadaceae bacterium]MDQ3584425.1 cation:proton antiporter [Acidobacteriota bacterium]
MNTFSAESFAAALAIIGVVIMVSALLSGLIERSGLPQVAVFLALGAALGPAGLGVLDLSLDSPALRVVATLSLALVLFTDAVSLNIAEVRRRSALALRLLGPGTLLSAALIAFAGWWLLGLPWAGAAILGAALASTDPVLLRGLLRRRDIPEDARHALQLESGLNDVVLLPVVLVAMVFLNQGSPLGGAGFAKLGLNLFILGPGAGILIGLLGVAALDLIRKRLGVRRDYESLYSLGVAFTAFAAAEAVHGSGFLAAFAAGMTIAALDVELCDCFVEYGGVTAEMLLLFTFVLLGGSLIWSGFTIINGATLVFTAIAVLIRTPVYLLSLLGSGVDTRGRLLIAWFGPRGLSSLLLVLLPVFAGLPGSEQLFAVCSLVVLVSVVLHGGSPMLLARAARRRSLRESAEAAGDDVARPFGPGPAMPEEATQIAADELANTKLLASSAHGDSSTSSNEKVATFATVPAASRQSGADTEKLQIGSQRISLEELRRLWQANEPVMILDVRTERSLEGQNAQASGAVRMPPDHVAERARELGLKQEVWLVAYCA